MSNAVKGGQVTNELVVRRGCSDNFAIEPYHTAASAKVHSQNRRILGVF